MAWFTRGNKHANALRFSPEALWSPHADAEFFCEQTCVSARSGDQVRSKNGGFNG
jgi:hypothetical protein